jgi:hypothetical protein
MNNKVLCCLICVVVIIVLLSIVIRNEKENFQHNYDAAASQYSSNYENNIPQTINSIVSKIDGTLLNVIVVNSNSSNNDKTIEILTDNYGSRLCMEDTTNNLSKCDVAKQWNLKFINDSVVINRLTNTNLGQSSTMVNYPFFMVLTSDDKLALQYNNGRFSVSPVGNYDSQKWDVSDYEIPQKQLFINDIYDGPLDKMSYSQESDPKDRVKINLNVNHERLKELLHIDSNTSSNSSDSSDSSKCDISVPKDSVENLCSGCKV